MKVKAIPITHNDQTFWFSKVKVKDILGKARVDVWTPENREAYQREVSRSRAKKFGVYMARGGVSPVAILVNIRKDEDSKCEITQEIEYINIPDDADWWIVDGQHRYTGLKEIIEVGEEKLREMEIPVIFMNATKVEEAKQFFIINKTQKGVRADLAERILYHLEQKEGREKILTEDLPVEIWKTKALRIVDILTETKESPLYGLIKRPGEKGRKPLKQVSVTDSLEPVLKYCEGYFKVENLAKALMNMWDAVKQLCPECFSNPTQYVLLKTTGVFVMHKIFANLAPTMREAKDFTKVAFARVFSHENMRRYFTADFWDKDNSEGAARFGTSKKSFKVVTDLIWGEMENVVQEIFPEEEIKLRL